VFSISGTNETATREVGQQTEEIALQYLQENGLTLVEKNFSHKIGEIDIIMRDQTAHDTLVFVEVRYRKNSNYGSPEETVTKKKQQKIKSTAQIFIAKNSQFKNIQPRFDVVAMTPGNSNIIMNWIKNAF